MFIIHVIDTPEIIWQTPRNFQKLYEGFVQIILYAEINIWAWRAKNPSFDDTCYLNWLSGGYWKYNLSLSLGWNKNGKQFALDPIQENNKCFHDIGEICGSGHKQSI